MEIIKDVDGSIYSWVVENLDNGEDYKNDLTVGIKVGNVYVCGIIYSTDKYATYLSIYATDPKWCTPNNLSRIFELPFKVFKTKIVKCLTSHKNKRINKLLWGLKLKEEGHLRFARADGTHLKIFSLTKKELEEKGWYK